MPLYEYRCESCGDVFELMQKFSDEPLTVHDKCGGKVVRVISAPALVFKGTGWYVTDYARGGNGRRNGKDEAARSEQKSDLKSDANSKSKSDSKSDSKSESSSAPPPKSDSGSKPDSKPAPAAKN